MTIRSDLSPPCSLWLKILVTPVRNKYFRRVRKCAHRPKNHKCHFSWSKLLGCPMLHPIWEWHTTKMTSDGGSLLSKIATEDTQTSSNNILNYSPSCCKLHVARTLKQTNADISADADLWSQSREITNASHIKFSGGRGKRQNKTELGRRTGDFTAGPRFCTTARRSSKFITWRVAQSTS